MDVIKFQFNHYKYGPDKVSSGVVDIYINGKLFLDINERFNGHAPITPSDLYENLTKCYKDDVVYIYGCGCGCPECDPIYVNVEVGEKIVTWYDLAFDACLEEEDLIGEYGRFVIDKKEYFNEIKKLKNWLLNKTLNISFESISYGYLSLRFEKNGKNNSLMFDELTSDPIPQLIRFRNHLRKGEEWEETIKDYDKTTLIISSRQSWNKEDLIIEVTMPQENILLRDLYPIKYIVSMFDKIIHDLLNDSGFPYVYPCYNMLEEDDEYWDIVDKEIDDLWDIAKYADKETMYLYLLGRGRVPMTETGGRYAAQYKAMLIEKADSVNDLMYPVNSSYQEQRKRKVEIRTLEMNMPAKIRKIIGDMREYAKKEEDRWYEKLGEHYYLVKNASEIFEYHGIEYVIYPEAVCRTQAFFEHMMVNKYDAELVSIGAKEVHCTGMLD